MVIIINIEAGVATKLVDGMSMQQRLIYENFTGSDVKATGIANVWLRVLPTRPEYAVPNIVFVTMAHLVLDIPHPTLRALARCDQVRLLECECGTGFDCASDVTRHFLSCMQCPGRVHAHNTISRALAWMLNRCPKLDAFLERTVPGSGHRPDVVLKRKADSASVSIDVTLTDPLAQSNVKRAAAAKRRGENTWPRAALDHADRAKRQQYSPEVRAELLVFAVTVFGRLHDSAMDAMDSYVTDMVVASGSDDDGGMVGGPFWQEASSEVKRLQAEEWVQACDKSELWRAEWRRTMSVAVAITLSAMLRRRLLSAFERTLLSRMRHNRVLRAQIDGFEGSIGADEQHQHWSRVYHSLTMLGCSWESRSFLLGQPRRGGFNGPW